MKQSPENARKTKIQGRRTIAIAAGLLTASSLLTASTATPHSSASAKIAPKTVAKGECLPNIPDSARGRSPLDQQVSDFGHWIDQQTAAMDSALRIAIPSESPDLPSTEGFWIPLYSADNDLGAKALAFEVKKKKVGNCALISQMDIEWLSHPPEDNSTVIRDVKLSVAQDSHGSLSWQAADAQEDKVVQFNSHDDPKKFSNLMSNITDMETAIPDPSVLGVEMVVDFLSAPA